MSFPRKRAALAGLAGVVLFAGVAFADTTSSLVPTSTGNYSQWTPSTGTTHYTLVDETTCNGTTDYVRTTTVGQRDSYAVSLTSIADGSKVTQIDVTPCASNNTSGASSTMKVFYRLNGTDSANSGAYLTSGTTPTSLATTSYRGLSTFKSGTATLEIGAVYFAGTKGLRLSKIATVVTYLAHKAPSSLTSSYSGGVSLHWTDNSAVEDGFKIERGTSTGSFAQIDTAAADATSYLDTTASDDTTYYYRVRAYNATADTQYSNYTIMTTLPNAPSALGAAPTGTNVALTWTDNSAKESGFKLERSTDGVNFTQFKTVGANVTSTTATGGLANTTYTFRIRAYNNAGNSVYSASASASTTPSAPSSLLATYSSGSVGLTWTDNAAVEDGFKIERSTDGGAYSQIDTALTNATSYNDPTVTAEHEYNYRVRAYNTAGNSSYSNSAYVQTYSSVPADPTSLNATLSGSTTIVLTWTDNAANEKIFKIERQFGTGSFVQIGTTNMNVTTFTNWSLSHATTYSYRVRASNPAGDSGYSNTAVQTTP